MICRDCGVEEGEYHKRGCCLEVCPYCGHQLLCCPDFLPKDIYKAVGHDGESITNSKSSCFRKRRIIEHDFRPLPTDLALSYWTKGILQEIKEYAIKKTKEEKLNHE
jgi:hypothetical protein